MKIISLFCEILLIFPLLFLYFLYYDSMMMDDLS